MPRPLAKLLPVAAALLSLGSSSLGDPGWAQPDWQPLAPAPGSTTDPALPGASWQPLPPGDPGSSTPPQWAPVQAGDPSLAPPPEASAPASGPS